MPLEVSDERPASWAWPTWCLSKITRLEVFVVDYEIGSARWVPAQALSRIVDVDGRDTYLCAEYAWGDDLFIEDFGPQRVRRAGDLNTVADILMQDLASTGVMAAANTKSAMTAEELKALFLVHFASPSTATMMHSRKTKQSACKLSGAEFASLQDVELDLIDFPSELAREATGGG